MAIGTQLRAAGLLTLSALAVVLYVLPAAAAPGGTALVPSSYADCAARIAPDPARALAAADAWADRGGGEQAARCRAAALVALSRPAEAAQLYEQLALRAQRLPERANRYALSSNAWLLAGQANEALAAIGHALEIYPDDPAMLIDRAEAEAALKRFAEAIEDLSRALDLDPGNVDALVFRASAYRQTEQLREASADLERALTIAPQDGEALLERGAVRRMRGDIAGARADWQLIVAVAPASPAAASARNNLAQLDAESRR